MNQPIACHLHDHLEVACLYRYQLCIGLTNGDQLVARARTTVTKPDKTEFLLLDSDAEEISIAMDRIAWIEPTTAGARFARIDFAVDDPALASAVNATSPS